MQLFPAVQWLVCLLLQWSCRLGHSPCCVRRMQYLKRKLLVRAVIASQDEAYKCADVLKPTDNSAASNAVTISTLQLMCEATLSQTKCAMRRLRLMTKRSLNGRRAHVTQYVHNRLAGALL